jgi:hypothetical protein
MLLTDTSVSEDDVLEIAGQVSDLPDPKYAIGIAIFVFLGVAVLQFSLGDLTKEVSEIENFCFFIEVVDEHLFHFFDRTVKRFFIIRKDKHVFEIFFKLNEIQKEKEAILMTNSNLLVFINVLIDKIRC